LQPLHSRLQCSAHEGTTGKTLIPTKPEPNKALHLTADSVRSFLAVRRESGVEECGNTLDIQVSNEPLELSATDHSLA